MRGAALSSAQETAFFETGFQEVDAMRARLAEEFGAPPGGRALDIGCGVGRLSFAMASHCVSVVGYDAAPAMIARAQARRAALNEQRARFTTEFPDGLFDWIHSYIVFQHIPPREGLALLRRALASLAPGGMASLHFMLWRSDEGGASGVSKMAPAWARSAARHVAQALDVRRARAGRAPVDRLIRMYDYDLTDVFRAVVEAGCDGARLAPVHQERHHGAWVLARKPG